MHLAVCPEARRDEHAAVGQPIQEGGLPPLLVAPDPGSERRISGWNAVEDERSVDAVAGHGEGLRESGKAESEQKCGQHRNGSRPAREEELDHVPKLA